MAFLLIRGVLWDIWPYEFGVKREDLKSFPPKNDVKRLVLLSFLP